MAQYRIRMKAADQETSTGWGVAWHSPQTASLGGVRGIQLRDGYPLRWPFQQKFKTDKLGG